MRVEIWILPKTGKNKDTPVFERRMNLEELPRIGAEFTFQTPNSKRIYRVWRKDIVLYSGKSNFKGIFRRILLRRADKKEEIGY